MPRSDDVWFECRGRDVMIYGVLTIEFEDSAKAREAVKRFLASAALALDGECRIEKLEV